MRRREMFAVLAGAATATLPLVARAQHPRMPVVGFLSASDPQRWLLMAQPSRAVAASLNGGASCLRPVMART